MASLLAALREERRLRAYLLASIVDDVGVALSTWAGALMMTNLFVDQRARAKFMVPMLCAFLLGALVAGPLADAARSSLARHRFRVVLLGRAIETFALAAFVVLLFRAPPTIATVLPYMLTGALLKTALRPARAAFEVDLLEREVASRELDENGAPRVTKVHLLTMLSWVSALRTASVLVGLFVGGFLMRAVHGKSAALFAADVVTNLVFIAVIAIGCRPRAESPTQVVAKKSGVREVFAFLGRRDQRPLLAMMAGSWVIEVASEAYDGKMIVKHVLHGTDDAVRRSEVVWAVFSVVALLSVAAIARRAIPLGRVFLLAMFVDGIVISVAGRLAGAAAAIPLFSAAIALDRGLTATASTLADAAMMSASSAAMRGRIAAVYALVVLVGDMGAEIVAADVADAIGIPAMLVRLGVVQIVVMAAIAALGGKALWRARSTEPAANAAFAT